MTKSELAKTIETAVEKLAVKYGATIETKQIKVGGKMQDSKIAVGGVFDLDGARNVFARNLNKQLDAIINTPLDLPSSSSNPDGPRLTGAGVVGQTELEKAAS